MTGISRPVVYWLAWGLLFACGSTPSAPDGNEEDSAIVLSWNRDGGFAGFCDELTISAAGDARAATCRTAGARTRKLSSEDLGRLNDWRKRLGTVNLTSGDPGSADSMTLKVTLVGKGRDQPSADERRQIFDWAQRIYTETIG